MMLILKDKNNIIEGVYGTVAHKFDDLGIEIRIKTDNLGSIYSIFSSDYNNNIHIVYTRHYTSINEPFDLYNGSIKNWVKKCLYRHNKQVRGRIDHARSVLMDWSYVEKDLISKGYKS